MTDAVKPSASAGRATGVMLPIGELLASHVADPPPVVAPAVVQDQLAHDEYGPEHARR